MDSLHSLLRRQLKRHFGDQFEIPAEWRAFLEGVNEAYRGSDTDRAMLERSLELSSQEMMDANSEMRAVFQAIPDLVFRLDRQGVILDIKAGASGELMSGRQDLIGKRIQDTPLKDVGEQFAEAIRQVVAENVPVSIEYSAVLLGQESDYEARLVPLPGSQIVVIIRNITERKQSLRLLGAAVEQSSESVVITDAELDLPGPRILFVNPAYTTMTGYSAADVLGQTPRLLQGPHSDRATLSRLRETLGRGETFAGETVNYRKDGTEFNPELQVTPLRNASGAITHFLSIQRDITARKRAETALRESDARYHALFEGSADGIAIVDVETKAFRYANPALCRMLGYTEGELCALRVMDVHPKGAVPGAVAAFEAQARGDVTLAADLPCLRKDGSVFPADISATKVTIDGRPCNVGFFRDITARKRAEERLHQLSQAVEQSPVTIVITDPAGNITYVNPKFTEITGYAIDEALGKNPRILKSNETPPETYEQLWRAITSGHEWCGEFHNRKKDGQLYWESASISPILNAAGKVTHFLAVKEDITEARLAKTKLAEASGLLDAMLENSTDMIYFKDRESRFMRFSNSLMHRLGATDPELMHRSTDADFFTAEHAQPALADEQEIIHTGQPIIGKLEKETYPDGHVTWALTTKMAWRDGSGAIMGTFGVSKDVTELKVAEEKLSQMQGRLIEASRQAGMAEIATNVIHNVGNVLNSVNVSATLIAEHVHHTRAVNVGKLAVLLDEHKSDLAGFLTHDPRGQMIPGYLGTLTELLAAERKEMLEELENLSASIEHIKDIVVMQQSYARASGVAETFSLPEVIEDALRINADSLARCDVTTLRDYQIRPVVTTDKHRVMQILINLLSNARHACDESGHADRQITVRITGDDGVVSVAVIDNGVGILAENLTRIFNHGFTTREGGHGFGLHSGALAARGLGGSLEAHSGGTGHGATFTLTLPYVIGLDTTLHENATR